MTLTYTKLRPISCELGTKVINRQKEEIKANSEIKTHVNLVFLCKLAAT